MNYADFLAGKENSHKASGFEAEGYVSVSNDRRFLGFELKQSYFELSKKYLELAENSKKQLTFNF